MDRNAWVLRLQGAVLCVLVLLVLRFFQVTSIRELLPF